MIDIQAIMANALNKMIDINIGIILLFFGVGILLFMIRNDLILSQREYNKMTEKSILLIVIMGIGIIYYLFSHQHYFVLFTIISVIMTYILYLVGFFDMLINKIERDKW